MVKAYSDTDLPSPVPNELWHAFTIRPKRGGADDVTASTEVAGEQT